MAEKEDSAADLSSSDEPSDSKRYNLRLCSQVNRVLVERRQEEPRRPKPKCKPPPLSKYRRKTANSRERVRMNEINTAFEDLRKVIPQYPEGKMTKITTLRLALNYLAELREMLGYTNDDMSVTSSPGSSGSVSDCSTSPAPAPESDPDQPFSDLPDIDTDASLNQLFELNLDSSLGADTLVDDFNNATGTCS